LKYYQFTTVENDP
jgi:hypothetical protein